jgi:ribonuclease-3
MVTVRQEAPARLAHRLAELGLRTDAPFSHPELITHALTHSSYVAEHGGSSNERLEMLGDAALGFAVAELLFDLFPDAQEGELTRLRASLVDETMLARKARELNLGGLIAMGRGEEKSGGRDRDSALADAFEAVAAAIYRSEGYAALVSLTDKLFRQEAIDGAARGAQSDDFKTALQDRAQEVWKVQPAYRISGVSGPDHGRLFRAEAWVGSVLGGQGEGRTKKSAEQQAARAALARWDEVVAEYTAAKSEGST